jgi:O-antigen/teichoic acid export membrane protein
MPDGADQTTEQPPRPFTPNGARPKRLARLLAAFTGSFAVSGGEALAAGVGAVSTILVARYLGPAGRGGVSFLQATSGLVTAVSLLGVPTLIVRRTHLGADKHLVGIVLTVAVVATVALTLVIVGLYELLSPGTYANFDIGLIALASVALNSAFLVVREAQAADSQERERFDLLAILRIFGAILPLVGTVIALIWQRNTTTVFLGITLGNIAVTLIFGWPFFSRAAVTRLVSARRRLRSQLSTARSNLQLRAALRSHLILTLLLLIYRLDVMVLAALATPSQVGFYSVAYVLAETPWLVANGFSVTIMPRLVRTHSSRDAKSIFRQALAVSTVAALIGAIALAVIGRPLIVWLLGDSFERSFHVLLLLLPGVVAFVPFKLVTTRLIAHGAPWVLGLLCLCLVIQNLACNVYAISRWGAAGCAATASLTYILGALLVFPVSRTGWGRRTPVAADS